MDFGTENVIAVAVSAFVETVALKVKQLRQFVPKRKDATNTELTGEFIEELVRGFVRDWLGGSLLLHGTLYHQQHIDSGDKPLQIDGIVYNPSRGPAILREVEFIVVHPAFCGGVIEIKMTAPLKTLEDRLQDIYAKHFAKHRTKPCVMGVIVADKDPEKVSQIPVTGGTKPAYDYAWANWCPIFVLFKETEDGDYLPHMEAIHALIRACYNNFTITTNYMG